MVGFKVMKEVGKDGFTLQSDIDNVDRVMTLGEVRALCLEVVKYLDLQDLVNAIRSGVVNDKQGNKIKIVRDLPK